MNNTKQKELQMKDFICISPKKHDDIIFWLQNAKEALHQDYNYIWVFFEFRKKLGLNITEYSILYMIFVLNKDNNKPLSRAELATILNLSIDTVNKIIPQLKKMKFEFDNDFGLIEKSPYLLAKTETKYYHENGTLIEREGKTYHKGHKSELIQLNTGIFNELTKLNASINNNEYVQRVKLIPAIAKVLSLTDEKGNKKPLTLSLLYRLECILAQEKMNKEGVKVKAEFSRNWGFSRQNFYTKCFKNNIKNNLIEDFKYRSEEDFSIEKSIMKIAPKYKQEVEFFYGQRKIFLPHKKQEKINPKSKLIMELWANHASATEVTLSRSNEITYSVINVLSKHLGFLNNGIFAEKKEAMMSIFNNFSKENEKNYSKITDMISFEKDLVKNVNTAMLSKIKADYEYITKFSTNGIPAADFNEALKSFGIVSRDLEQNLRIFIDTYKKSISEMLN